jgi:hypothetical protein
MAERGVQFGIFVQLLTAPPNSVLADSDGEYDFGAAANDAEGLRGHKRAITRDAG